MTLTRIGESSEFGWLLLELLHAGGWNVQVRAGFAGGLHLIAEKPGKTTIEKHGERVADFACDAFMDAMRQDGRLRDAA